MTDKKDKPPSKETPLDQSSNHDTLKKASDIDTSHLSLDETDSTNKGSLEKEKEIVAPTIDTSHLSLDDSDKATPLVPDAPELTAATKNPQQPNKPEPETKSKNKPENELENKSESKSEPTPTDNLLFVKNPLASSAAPQSNSATESGDQKNTDEEVVLLSSHTSDEDFDQEILPENDKKNPEKPTQRNKGDQTDNPIKSLLDTVKKPESIVQNAWTNSSARRYLLDNVESYRVKDEDKNMEDVIEKVYGGTAKKKVSPGKFLKENILFSFLLFIFLFLVGWKGAGILFPDLMPQLNDQIIKTVTKTAVTKKVEKKQKTIETNHENKEKIDLVLSHCLVEPSARIAFHKAFTPIGYQFTDKNITLSYEELHDAVRNWQGMEMDFYIPDAILRFRELSRLAMPVIVNANKAVSDYSELLSQAAIDSKNLDQQIRGIQTKLGNQSTSTINQRIPLRAKRDKIDARLTLEPSQDRFNQLIIKLSLVENVLAGKIEPKRIKPDELTLKDPEWLISTSETPASDIATPIFGKVLPPIQIPADKLRHVQPKLTAFRLVELEKALDDLLKLAALITYVPENRLLSYQFEILSLTRKLNSTMGKEMKTWLNFDSCLTEGRKDVPAQAK